jgi:hypothetical protein
MMTVEQVWTAGTDYFTEGKWYWINSREPITLPVEGTTNNPWYNCVHLNPGRKLNTNYCEIDFARALCQDQ